MHNIKKNIFNRKKLTHLISKYDFSKFENNNQKQIIEQRLKLIRSQAFITAKETALSAEFLIDIFEGLLGYTSQTRNPELWHLNHEQLTTIDGKFADGGLGFFSDRNKLIRAVIELKSPKTNLDEKQTRINDNRTPIEQAFSYQSKIGSECKWVIVSNFNEIRLYHESSATEYEVFFISDFENRDTIKKFIYLMGFENLISQSGDSFTDNLFKRNEQEEKEISKQFYIHFKKVRINLFKHLKEHNPDYDVLILIEKTQKLLNRFVFIFFCEDNHLLPEKIFKQIVDIAKTSFVISETKIWNEIRGLFNAINVGSLPHNINKYNGGLFSKDEALDNLHIKDSILKEIIEIADYDFDSDIDVNILGHIFEQSINDIEELKSNIEGNKFDKKTSKRKKDGIFYTPEYITKYIVENTVGGWLENKKIELGYLDLPELKIQDYQSISSIKGLAQSNPSIYKHLQFWIQYEIILKNIKVLDPACGSGAFLNQAFNYLYSEGQKVNEQLAILTGGQRYLFQLDKHILSNNLYGVDLNSESVQITKLSLWLKTANKYSELTALDNNIKCGNSLIDDPSVAGDKAFDWENEFPDIMSAGGFDVVIGNPPWGAELSRKEIENITENYPEISSGEVDTYIVFMIKGIKILKSNGYLGYIVPDTWLSLQRTHNLRKYIFDNSQIIDIYDRYKPFDDAKDTRSHSIILRQNNIIKEEYNFTVKISDSNFQVIKDYVLCSDVLKNFKEWNLYKSNDENKIFQKMISISTPLNKLFNIKYGLRTGDNNKYLSKTDINGLGFKIARGSHIQRYYFNWTEEYLVSKEGLPSSYFESNNLNEKIILQYVRTNSTDIKARWLEATIIENLNYVPLNSTSYIFEKSNSKLKYLLTILSSYLMNFYYKAHYTDVNVKPIYLAKLPIPVIENQLPFIELADLMLEKNRELQNVKNKFLDLLKADFKIEKLSTKLQNWYELSWADFTSELKKLKIELKGEMKEDWSERFNRMKAKTAEIKNIIDTTDRKIDCLVYELYGLTEEEIRVVEGE